VSERLKYQEYTSFYANNYFWRTWDQKEIDFLEERGGGLFGYEFKWSSSKIVLPPADFFASYPGSEFRVINAENYLEFVS